MDFRATTNQPEPALPIPLHARKLLRSLPTLPGAAAIRLACESVLNQVTAVTRLRRLGIVAATAAFPFLAGGGVIFGTTMLEHWERQQPGVWELSQLLYMRSGLRHWARQKDAPDDQSFEVYIANHYGQIITNKTQWTSLYTLSMIKGKERRFAEESIGKHPNPTEEQVRVATNRLKPLLANVPKAGFGKQRWFPLAVVGLSALMYVGIPALFAALLFKGGIIMRGFRVGVVRTNGQEAGRLRLFARSLIAWSPLLAGPIMFAVWAPVLGTAMALSAALLVVVGFTAWSVALPDRGLQDRLARTFLVPR
jgi:hypothetical protein